VRTSSPGRVNVVPIAARSSSVRASDVQGMPSISSQSCGCRRALTYVRTPWTEPRRCGTVTSTYVIEVRRTFVKAAQER
jgi:hypothetical protein